MRIAIAGFMHESNTFAPLPTDRRRFQEGSWTEGDAILDAWGQAHHEVGGFLAASQSLGFEPVPTLMAWATPAGPVDDAVLDEVVDTIVDRLAREPVDGLLIALHGAMVTPRFPSADGEVLRRLRGAFGPDFPIVATLDFHANVSPAMTEAADPLVGYQTYPHVDQKACGMKAAELMIATVRREVRPVVGLSKPPLILNLLAQDTDREPMRSLMLQARELERAEGIISVSLMAGFPYADVPDMGPSVIAVADGDRDLAQAAADRLAEAVWAVREALDVHCPNPEEAVRMALSEQRTPVVLVDLGDNVGGGSAGDGTVLLAEFMRQGATGAIVTLFDPEAQRLAREVGPGGSFETSVGGQVDDRHGPPVEVVGTVRSLHDGRWRETEARHGGRLENDQGPTAVVDLEAGITLVLNSLRTPPFSLGQLTSLSVEPREARVIVVKAAVAHKAAYGPIAARMIEVDTPGLTAINPSRFEYRHVRRPMYPLL
jgi:microcystin degradation protein MlrC